MKKLVDIKSVYMMSSEFELSSGESMLKILIPGGLNKRGVGISSWHCNSLKWWAFPKFQLIGSVVVIVGDDELKIWNLEYSNSILKVYQHSKVVKRVFIWHRLLIFFPSKENLENVTSRYIMLHYLLLLFIIKFVSLSWFLWLYHI